MSRSVHLDANVILRFLRNDDAQQSPITAEFFKRAQLGELHPIVSSVTVLEVFYVLSKVYRLAPVDTARIVHTFLASGLALCEDGGVTLDALRRITANKISFGDAYLAATATSAKEEIASFDKGVAAFKDVRIYPLDSLKSAPKK
jgi:predicted nucleic acid-binding protein